MSQEPTHKSLDEINQSVEVPSVYETSFVQKFLAYSGPGALAVGYMDPGNWLTSLSGGSQFRYALLSVLLMSILVATFMQTLSIKLGVVARLDLAQAIAQKVPKAGRYTLWIINELAMMATDMTGGCRHCNCIKIIVWFTIIIWDFIHDIRCFISAIIFKIWNSKNRIYRVAAILIVGVIFGIEVSRATPDLAQIAGGLLPTPKILTNHEMLIMSLGIVGATIMPHNIYLHSSLAQSRRYDYHNPAQVNEALRFAKWDSNVHLVAAFLINALLLVLGGTLFFHTNGQLSAFQDVYNGLKSAAIVGNLASPLMSTLFAFALLITGMISSITSTLSGQIVMEGYLHIRLPLWERRLLTRFVTLIPILAIGFLVGFNDHDFEQIIVYAQIALSIALPFTLFPMVALTSNHDLMGVHTNQRYVTMIGYLLTAIITVLNLQFVIAAF